jgi:hypothetical protein
MPAAWLWVPGAYGSTQNDGWLEVVNAQLGRYQAVSFSVTPDGAEPSLFSMSIRGDVVGEVIYFIEPQRTFRFYPSTITGVSSSGGNTRTLSIEITYDKISQSYDP